MTAKHPNLVDAYWPNGVPVPSLLGVVRPLENVIKVGANAVLKPAAPPIKRGLTATWDAVNKGGISVNNNGGGCALNGCSQATFFAFFTYTGEGIAAGSAAHAACCYDGALPTGNRLTIGTNGLGEANPGGLRAAARNIGTQQAISVPWVPPVNTLISAAVTVNFIDDAGTHQLFWLQDSSQQKVVKTFAYPLLVPTFDRMCLFGRGDGGETLAGTVEQVFLCNAILPDAEIFSVLQNPSQWLN